MRDKNVKNNKYLTLGIFLVLSIFFQIVNSKAAASDQNCYIKNDIKDNFKIRLDNPLSQGNFGYIFPVDLPEGINYTTPLISLVYNSEISREKFLGVGWELVGYNQIRRNDRLGVPWYDSRDSYILTLNGSELVFDANGTFENKTDYSIRTSGGNWILTETDGSTQIFNKAISSSKGGYLWTLAEKKDINGNTINYTYDIDNTNGVAYLQTISYQSQEKSKVIITFNYTTEENLGYPVRAEGNLDPSYHYWAGFPICYKKRLTSIEVGSNTYKISYKKSSCSLRLLVDKIISSTGRTANFTYQSDGVIAGWEKSNKWLLRPMVYNNSENDQTIFYSILDFNNDGFPDFVSQKWILQEAKKSEACFMSFPEIYLNNDQGGWTKGFDFATTSGSIPGSFATVPPLLTNLGIYQRCWWYFFDVNNDGFLDALTQFKLERYNFQTKGFEQKSRNIIYYNDGAGNFNDMKVAEVGEYADLDEGLSNLIDLNCDGINDSFPSYFEFVYRYPGSYSVGDYNGDRYPDFYLSIYRYDPIEIDYSDNILTLNLGDGAFENLYNSTDMWEYSNLPKQVQFFDYIINQWPDVNGDKVGDSITDRLYYNKGYVFPDSRYNITGITEFDRKVMGYWTDVFADINNDGFVDAVLPNGTYLNKAKPDLVTGISGTDNYEITYTRVSVRVQDEAPEGRIYYKPNIFRWAVKSLKINGTALDFAYSGGLHDLFRREFRGYEKIQMNPK
jgi:hypothetical protein